MTDATMVNMLIEHGASLSDIFYFDSTFSQGVRFFVSRFDFLRLVKKRHISSTRITHAIACQMIIASSNPIYIPTLLGEPVNWMLKLSRSREKDPYDYCVWPQVYIHMIETCENVKMIRQHKAFPQGIFKIIISFYTCEDSLLKKIKNVEKNLAE